MGNQKRDQKLTRRRVRRQRHVLQAASRHLLYEFSMFKVIAHIMQLDVFGTGLVNNAMIESFVLHARVLLDFAYAANPHPDDVIAEDFFDDPADWASARPAQTSNLATLHPRVGTEVAHLSYARNAITPEKKKWRFLEIAEDMQNVFDCFVGLVPRQNLASDWMASPAESGKAMPQEFAAKEQQPSVGQG